MDTSLRFKMSTSILTNVAVIFKGSSDKTDEVDPYNKVPTQFLILYLCCQWKLTYDFNILR